MQVAQADEDVDHLGLEVSFVELLVLKSQEPEPLKWIDGVQRALQRQVCVDFFEQQHRLIDEQQALGASQWGGRDLGRCGRAAAENERSGCERRRGCGPSPRPPAPPQGWLGGLDPIPNFNPLLQMASGVYLTFFGSFVFGTPGFPLSDVPLQQIAGDAAAGRLDIKPAKVFRFEDIQEAHRVMDANQAGGKVVVVRE